MWLPANQLECLNDNIQTQEAFCKLLKYYAEDYSYSEHQFLEFLEKNKDHLNMVNCIDIIHTHGICISSAKMDKIRKLYNAQ